MNRNNKHTINNNKNWAKNQSTISSLDNNNIDLNVPIVIRIDILRAMKGKDSLTDSVLDSAIAALEKQIPKSPIDNSCPCCGASTKTDTGEPFLDYNLTHCDNCGQRLIHS
jgi:hypothetical protein